MDNAGSKVAVDKKAEREKSRRAQELADVHAVMSMPGGAGRRFINRIVQFSEVMGEVFHTNGSITNLNLGKRKVGLFVYGELEEASPELSLLMRQEYVKENSDG